MEVTPLPQCPELSLWLLDPNYPQWKLSHEQAASLMDTPPFWSFCWASGQVLARYILDHPELVKGKSVLDFGAGSGVVGISAMMAGATKVICCDQDETALQACLQNAKLNDVEVDIINDLSACLSCDIATVADVFYDRDNLALMDLLHDKADHLLIADSRLRGGELDHYKRQGIYESHTVPDLDESRQFNSVSIYT